MHGFMLNVVGRLVAYQFKENKPQLHLTPAEFGMIAVTRKTNLRLSTPGEST